jgi:hypothetical protein
LQLPIDIQDLVVVFIGIILNSSPKLVEEFKWSMPNYTYNGLVCYIQTARKTICYTNFQDFIMSEESNAAMYNASDLKNYKKKVEHYLKEHKDEMASLRITECFRKIPNDITSLQNPQHFC